MNVSITSLTAHQSRSRKGTALFNMSVVIKNTAQLDKIIRDLGKHPDVIEVYRSAQ